MQWTQAEYTPRDAAPPIVVDLQSAENLTDFFQSLEQVSVYPNHYQKDFLLLSKGAVKVSGFHKTDYRDTTNYLTPFTITISPTENPQYMAVNYLVKGVYQTGDDTIYYRLVTK